ncbi:DUF2231 domain-containing protein [Nostocoides sp. F2B08]|uniref:DUF2231 domain-containing protein n=1 Tax=Nostocoides sp. F2B08 TaxID=2653936 RepID=UPI0012635CF4|nr:DUF2231 domain-containing protein [Tetrasphaera sp. F2B08]KAB7745093.1 DUF2231 domain-containing protein [Tetrasphaera sp. F2B08]
MDDQSTSHPDTPASTHDDRAKAPKSALQGLYGHPVHPILVTIPIGAWTSSLVFDGIAQVVDDPAPFATGSAWLIGIGAVGAVLAAVTGGLDWKMIPRGTAAWKTGLVHMLLNIGVLTLYLVNLAVRRGQGLDDVSVAALVMSVVGMATLGASGWLGGKLAYRYGVRVADETTQAEGFRPA